MNKAYLSSMHRMDAAALGVVLLLAQTDDVNLRAILSSSDAAPTVAAFTMLPDAAALCAWLDGPGVGDAAALILAEEVLDTVFDRLAQALANQPSWSDLPILVIMNRNDVARAASRWTQFEALGNVTILELPLDPSALRNALRIALRDRKRQQHMRRQQEALQIAAETPEGQAGKDTGATQGTETHLRAVFDASRVFQSVLDVDGRLLDTNAASLAAIGVPLSQLGGLPYCDAPWFSATPGMSALVQDMVRKAGAGQAVRQPVTIDLPQGRRGFDLFVRPMLNEAGETFALLAEAVETSWRPDAGEGLHQAQKMEAIGQLTGGVAHDFNNLLTVVIGSLGLLQRRVVHDSGLTRLVEVASTAAQRGAKLTQQLLAFARRQPLQPADVDLNDVIRTISELLERTVSSGNKLVFAYANTPLPVRVDRTQLEMAVLNLVVNARDASENGGRIIVETGRVSVADAASDGTEAGRISLTVRDEGIGMTRDVMDRVFEPFFTTKKAGVGTGMGLSMVYGFVRQSGGDITIDSAPNQGTTVQLLLPESEPAVQEEEEDAVSELRPSQGERILVVEDDPAVQSVATETLQQLGYPIQQASTGEAALRMLEELEDIDLLFTDVIMPGSIDGITLARIARQKRPDLRILVTSGRLPDGADLRSGLGAKGAFLPKPYQPLDLALAVQNLLDAI